MWRRMLFVLVAVSSVLFSSRPAHAWNALGHRVIADIAYDLLDDDTKAKAVALIKASPRFTIDFLDRMPANVKSDSESIKDRWHFQHSATWADIVRGNNDWSIEKWHYINKPFFLSDLDEKALSGKEGIAQSTKLPEKIAPNADPADLNAVQALQLCLERISSPTTPKEKKATYLLWVMHIVGDLHQPLHSTSLYSRGRFQKPGGDRGGNSIKTKQNGNLHALWDGLLGSNTSSLNTVRGRAQQIIGQQDLKKLGEASAAQIDASVWVDEGHVICKEFAYSRLILDEVGNKEASPKSALATLVMPTEYMKQAGRIAEERAIQGAYRLATILKKYVK